MLGKMLDLTGTDNSFPKTSQKVGSLRRAVNVYKTPDKRIIPRSEVADYPELGTIPGIRYIHALAPYNNDTLAFVSYDSSESDTGIETYELFYTTSNGISYKVPRWGQLGIPPFIFNDIDYSSKVQTYRINNTVYFFEPYGKGWSKYDGVEVSPAGCRQPIISCAQRAVAGAAYVRVIQHTLDFDNNEPCSEVVQFRASPGTGGAPANTIRVHTSNTGTNVITFAYTPLPVDSYIRPNNILADRSGPAPYFYGTAVYNAGPKTFTVTSTSTNISSNHIGTYIFTEVARTNFLLSGAGPADCLALLITNVVGTTITLSATNVRYLDANNEWQIGELDGAYAANIAYGTKYACSVYVSNSANGDYYYRKIIPSFPDATVAPANNLCEVDCSSLVTASTTYPISSQCMATISDVLGDWYDVSTRKVTINCFFPWGDIRSITKYQGLFFLASEDVIWFSDNTINASIEQFSAANFRIIGDREYGEVVAICGTQDFLYVGRERKNYYVTGNIETGNYRVQEIVETDVGPYSNNAAINVKDSVIFVSSKGIYQIVAGGKCVKISETIPENFMKYDDYTKNDDIVFELSDLNTYQLDNPRTYTEDIGLGLAHDEFRNLLLISGMKQDACLVMNTENGEFYEWNGVTGDSNFNRAMPLAFKGEFYYAVQPSDNGYGAKIVKEDNSLYLNYPSSYPIYVLSSWMTAGEPSLEKQLQQVKIFGRIYNDTSGLLVKHYKDWDKDTAITSSAYIPDSSSKYSHKKRLTADKALAVSVGFEVNDGTKFEIEGMEVEFESIQEGMKR